ncbi:MAG: ABC transporter permease, partial [Clostridiales bacterium]|nr:ABC transporter permease [Clostridiales bacterium]
GSPRFVALANREVDVIDAFATDGMLLKYKLKVLKDEDHVFPPYYAVPCFSSDTLKKYPELREVVDKLAPKLTDEVMMKLNYQVDVKGREPKDVAREYLKREKLI